MDNPDMKRTVIRTTAPSGARRTIIREEPRKDAEPAHITVGEYRKLTAEFEAVKAERDDAREVIEWCFNMATDRGTQTVRLATKFLEKYPAKSQADSGSGE